MDYQKLAERLLPENYPALSAYEELYPPRDLGKGAEVTRLAPSPTGFIHLGNLFVAIANERIAHQSGGVLYLRIEDTDEKRKVDGAVEALEFGVTADVPFIGVPLKDLKLRNGLLLAGIVRQNGKIIIPSGNDCLNLGDDVIVVTTDTSLQDIHDICRK